MFFLTPPEGEGRLSSDTARGEEESVHFNTARGKRYSMLSFDTARGEEVCKCSF